MMVGNPSGMSDLLFQITEGKKKKGVDLTVLIIYPKEFS